MKYLGEELLPTTMYHGNEIERLRTVEKQKCRFKKENLVL